MPFILRSLLSPNGVDTVCQALLLSSGEIGSEEDTPGPLCQRGHSSGERDEYMSEFQITSVMKKIKLVKKYRVM